ncbi:Vacuolar protein sorting-associated protein 53 A-like protein [Drosera capensis]
MTQHALQRTLEFEEELAEKFGGNTQSRETKGDADDMDKGESNSRLVTDIRKKYEKKLAAHQRDGNEEKDGHKDLQSLVQGKPLVRFDLSSHFSPPSMVSTPLSLTSL